MDTFRLEYIHKYIIELYRLQDPFTTHQVAILSSVHLDAQC